MSRDFRNLAKIPPAVISTIFYLFSWEYISFCFSVRWEILASIRQTCLFIPMVFRLIMSLNKCTEWSLWQFADKTSFGGNSLRFIVKYNKFHFEKLLHNRFQLHYISHKFPLIISRNYSRLIFPRHLLAFPGVYLQN